MNVNMDLFDSNSRTGLSEVYTLLQQNFDENDDCRNNHILLDMDTLKPPRQIQKICPFDDKVNSTGWLKKPIENWCKDETVNWLISAASCIEQPYSLIQGSLAVPGNELATFSKDDFNHLDPIYGDRLYNLLHSQISNILPSHSEDENARINSSNTSDAESDNNSIDVSIKRPPGRPKGLKNKKNPASQGKLWEFIRDLLHNREACPRIICWEDYSQATFRFVDSVEVARLWGSRKGNTKMTYEKLSRAMRYYYKSKIFEPVPSRKLVYRFGPNAKGWQTNNPNFRH